VYLRIAAYTYGAQISPAAAHAPGWTKGQTLSGRRHTEVEVLPAPLGVALESTHETSTRDPMSTHRSVDDISDTTVRYYVGLPYHVALARDGTDEEQPWCARVEELAGCMASGASAVDAVAAVPGAIAAWVTEALAQAREVPEPRSARSYSGRLLLRMPLSLHAELAQAAERDQVSLNAYITAQLAVAVRPQRTVRAQDRPASAARAQAIWWALVINLAVVSIAALVVLALILVGTDGI
jgi:antitoxin HicB